MAANVGMIFATVYTVLILLVYFAQTTTVRLKRLMMIHGVFNMFTYFDGDILIGYSTLDAEIFGQKQKYVLLDQLFVSREYRNKGIGKKLFALCAKQARGLGAEKIFLCAGSSENTIAFYQGCGCKKAAEINQKLFEEDPRDIQLEFDLENPLVLRS